MKELSELINLYKRHHLLHEAEALNKVREKFRTDRYYPLVPKELPSEPLSEGEANLPKLREKYDGAIGSKEFLTPTFQTLFWRDMWACEPSIVVPECGWSDEDLRRPMIDIRGNSVESMLIYIPAKVEEEYLGRNIMARQYPSSLINLLLEPFPTSGYGTWNYGSFQNTGNTGYVKVEATHEAPNLDSSVYDLRHFFIDNPNKILLGFFRALPYGGRLYGQRLVTYSIFTQALYVLTGKYPDTKTKTRLGFSSEGDYVLAFAMLPDGLNNFNIGGDDPPYWIHYPSVGARFEELPKEYFGRNIKTNLIG